MYFVDGDHSCDRPVETEGVRLVPRQHVEFDSLVAFKFKRVRSGYLALGRYLADDLFY